MEIGLSSPPEGSRAARPPSLPAPRLRWPAWVVASLRCAFFLAPRTGEAQPTPTQLAWLFALNFGMGISLERLLIAGPAHFLWRTSLSELWQTLLVLWLAWAALEADSRRPRARMPERRGLASWLALVLWIELPASLIVFAQTIAITRGALSALPEPWLTGALWTTFALATGWMLAAQIRLTARYLGSRFWLAVFALASAGLTALFIWQFNDRHWIPDTGETRATAESRPRLRLTQELFEQQQAITEAQFAAILPERPGITDVYGLVFAPYAGEEVFRRESAMVADVLRSRFDADGRVLVLLNHAETSASLPWATPQNLRRAIDALAARMDRQNDLLVIYMTSHGASDFKLAARNIPLEVPPLTPTMLRAALDAAGIVHRALFISACFSGGWIAPLESDTTLVITAADAGHTSYGCGLKSELTFFGRAMFDEQLRKTHSFKAAYDQARIDIQEREVEAGKDDGFSNPQISVGKAIVPLLDALEKRLDQMK